MIGTFLGATGVRAAGSAGRLRRCGRAEHQAGRQAHQRAVGHRRRELMATTGIRRAWILNDVEAMAYGVPALRADELKVLQTGEFNADGNACLMAAGHGPRAGHPRATARPPGAVALRGRALGFRPARAARDRPARVPDVAVRPRDLRAHHLGQGVHQPASVHERQPVAVAHRGTTRTTCRPRSAAADWTAPTRTASRRCSCSSPSTAAPRPTWGCNASPPAASTSVAAFPPSSCRPSTCRIFMDAFRAKPPMNRLVERMPVSIVLNRQTGLLGAAVYAASLLK